MESPRTAAFTSFMRAYQDMVYTTAVRLLGDPQQAEDIAQEVFVRAYESFDALSASPTAGGWLKTVTRNLSLNHLTRHRRRWRFFADDTDDEGGAIPDELIVPDSWPQALDDATRHRLVEQALSRLPDTHRVPLVLYHYEELSYQEIAQRLDLSLAKVKTDIHRGRLQLARLLDPAVFGEGSP
jgi:RNA polymerase sigma-70 factor, ECF subfamily